jgi:hypothetical protein
LEHVFAVDEKSTSQRPSSVIRVPRPQDIRTVWARVCTADDDQAFVDGEAGKNARGRS